MTDSNTGLIGGKPHENGGTPIIVQPSGIMIEAELNEYLICKSAMESTQIHEFKQKTNKEILDEIHQKEGCKYVPGQAQHMDFIVCKLVVNDQTKRDLTGTVKEIINKMQAEKSCNVSEGNSSMSAGGYIGDNNGCTECQFSGMSEFEIDLWTNYLWWMDLNTYN